MNTKNIILLEFNELCPHLLDKWMAAGLLPNFRKFFENSAAFITQADVDKPEYLEPWIQWYSMHTGLSYEQHGVFRLTDGAKAEYDDIWRVLIRNGLRVGNFSSMNTRGFTAPGCFFMADPWCTSETAYPESLNVFHRFVSSAVQEYSSPNRAAALKELLNFIKFLVTHGFSIETAGMIAKQLITDKLLDKNQYWKRASILDRVLFDVFRYYHKKYNPNFATFFINSTAHYQHSYWRHMEPEKFTIRPTEEEQQRYQNAILYGYQRMDALLSRFFELESPNQMLILASALSQQPFLKYENSGGQHFYRPLNVKSLLSKLNFSYDTVDPVMTHQYMIRTSNADDARKAFEGLQTIFYDGNQVFQVERRSDTSVYFGSQIRCMVPQDATLSIGDAKVGFYEILYSMEGIKSGCHHPDGILWLKTGSHIIPKNKASILDVFPTILEHFGISHTHSTTMLGKSLLPLIGTSPRKEAATA